MRVTRARPARLPARSRRGEAASFCLSASLAQRRPPPHRGPESGRSRLSTPPMYRRPVSFGAFPVYQVVLWAVAVGGAAQVISGAVRLGSADGSAARLGGSALLRRLGSSAGLFFFSSSLVASSSSLSRVVTSSARTRTRRGAASRAGRLRSRPRRRSQNRRKPERAATSGGLAAPRDAAQLREAAVAAGWPRRRNGVVAPRW